MRKVACSTLFFAVWAFCIALPVEPALLWQADPSLAPNRSFEGVEQANGQVTVVDDPRGMFGKVFHFVADDNPSDPGYKDRCEVKGMRLPEGTPYRLVRGSAYFLGWRSLWEPLPTKSGAWMALFQIHGYGQTGCGAPLVFWVTDGKTLTIKYEPPSGSSPIIWTTPLVKGSWQSFVLHFNVTLTPSEGVLELWYNGKQQTFSNGKTQYPAALWNCSYIAQKWGVYRSGANQGIGADHAYLSGAKLGTEYADVDPMVPTQIQKSGAGATAGAVDFSPGMKTPLYMGGFILPYQYAHVSKTVSIFNASGKLVLKTFAAEGVKRITAPNTLNNGIYIIRIQAIP
jgi:hypothetical protein